MRPYVIGAFLFRGILWMGNRWVVPNANRIRTTFENTYIRSRDAGQTQYDRTTRVDSFTYVTFSTYDPNYKSGSGFVMEKGRKPEHDLQAAGRPDPLGFSD